MQIRKILLVTCTMYSVVFYWVDSFKRRNDVGNLTLLSRWFPTSQLIETQLIGTQLIGVNKLRVN